MNRHSEPVLSNRNTAGVLLLLCLMAATPAVPAAAAELVDDRERLRANIFAGIAVDNFAAGELLEFLNEDDANDIRERFVAGFRVSLRPTAKWKESADEDKDKKDKKAKKAVWVDVEVSHGMRSASVDCKAKPEIAVCKDIFDPATVGERTLFIIREATSLEGALRLRKEFKHFASTNKDGGEDPPDSALYAVAHLGFLTVSGSGSDVIDNHHLGLGLVATQGDFRGSHLEFGYGKTDLFAERSDDRWKADALLRWSVSGKKDGKFKDRFWIFARVTVDADFGAGSDSIISFFGVEVSAKLLK